MKIAVIYVTYNPSVKFFLKSVNLCALKFEKVIVFDNSYKSSDDLYQTLKAFKNVEILSEGKNVGIADALNYSCRYAIELGYQFALTLDQDSFPPYNIRDSYENFLSMHSQFNIGAIGPICKMRYDEIVQTSNTFEEVQSLITSGCLINLSAFLAVRGFKGELFIDSVDTEFSWNLRKNGYKLFKLNNVVLEHQIGQQPYNLILFGKRLLTVTNHNYLRCYYITRNSLRVGNDYSTIFPKEAKNYKKGFKLFIKVLFFEKDKFRKILSIFYGYIDYKRGLYGKYSH